jgi:hypothetical protein
MRQLAALPFCTPGRPDRFHRRSLRVAICGPCLHFPAHDQNNTAEFLKARFIVGGVLFRFSFQKISLLTRFLPSSSSLA